MADKIVTKLNEEVYPKEAYICGVLFNEPSIYDNYKPNKLSVNHLGNGIWKFYLGLGRHLQGKGIEVFDDISVAEAVNELMLQSKYEKYGGYDTINELMIETKNKSDNFDGYYLEVKKYSFLREMYDLIGSKVIKPSGKYDYKKFTLEQLQVYWDDKFETIKMNNNVETAYKEDDLLADLDKIIKELDESPDIGMPYYKSKLLTDYTVGDALETLTIISAFSGAGKSSFITEKKVMQCMIEKEKLALIVNEMNKKAYVKMLLPTVMSGELYEKFKDEFKDTIFNRKNLNKGNFTPDEKAKLNYAVQWIKDTINGQNDLIKFITMEDYTMDAVVGLVRKWSKRGYLRWIIDTAKPSEGGSKDTRWEQFVQDFDTLYKLVRPQDAGGLGVSITAMVQNADDKMKERWLNYDCIADGKKIKNVADVCMHLRRAWVDEYAGEPKEIKTQRWIPAEDSLNGRPEKIVRTLEAGKAYYLLFISKNRRGDVSEGGGVIVYEVNLNNNRWKEVGISFNVRRDSF
jgi:replicative DNA helicase